MGKLMIQDSDLSACMTEDPTSPSSEDLWDPALDTVKLRLIGADNWTLVVSRTHRRMSRQSHCPDA